MSELKGDLKVDDIVWASAKRSIFWPAQVIEADVNGALYTVHFFGEGTVETIKNPDKILHFSHPLHGQFISIGRKQHNIDKKLQFNKGLAAADREMKSHKAQKQVPLRRSPRKATPSTLVGCDSSGLGAKSRNNMGTSKENGSCNKKAKESFIKRTLSYEGAAMGSSEMAATRKSPQKKMKTEELVERNPQKQKYSPRKRGNSEIGGGDSNGETTKKYYKAEKQTKYTKVKCDQNKQQLSESTGGSKRRNKKGKLGSSDDGDAVMSEGGPEGGGAKCSKIVMSSLETSDNEGAQVSSAQCACLGGENAVKTGKKKTNNDCHKDKVVESRSSETSGDSVGTNTGDGSKLDGPLCCQNQEDMDEEKAKSNDKDKDTTGADCPSNSDSSSDDDDLPEVFSPSQEQCSPGAFALHDVVWAKYQTHPFWPSQILKILGKRKHKKYYVKFLCDPCHHLIHIQEKNLFPFSCSQRQTFVDAGNVHHHFFDAVTTAEDLVNRKGLGKSLEEDIEADDYELVENASDTEKADEQQEEKESLETRAPVLKRRSSRERKQVSRYSDILSYIREALPTLKLIYEGKKPSGRHRTYMHGRDRERDKLKLEAGFGPIGNTDTQDEIMELLLRYLQEVTKENQFSAVTYVSDVWLPEAIIFAIQRKDLVDRESAEEMYLTGSELAVSKADVEQFTQNLKGKTLTDEDRDACWKRVERALARHTGAVP